MPLLRRKAFVKNKIPEDLDEDEEVFYCELTKEVFRDYEEFCQRVILCNSLVWSCALTGKPQLTYQEALQSEENARALIKTFPKTLVVPVLYLASLTQRTSFGELTEDVFNFVRDRYFLGERVEVNLRDDVWYPGIVTMVIPPTEKEVAKYLASNSDISCRDCDIPTFPPASMFCYKVKVTTSRPNILVAKHGQLRRTKGHYTREKNRLFLKHVTEHRGKLWIVKENLRKKYKLAEKSIDQIFCENVTQLGLTKKASKASGISSKSETKLLQNGAAKKEKRQETIQKYFKSPGKTETSPSKKTSPNKKDVGKKGVGSGKQETLDKRLSPKKKQMTLKKSPKKYAPEPPQKQQIAKKLKDKYKDVVNQKKRDATKNLIQKHKMNKQTGLKGLNDRLTVEERRQKMREEKKERALEEKRKRVEEKIKERAKLKEEKLKLAEFMKEWNRQREDLECEDLKELPAPNEIKCPIPNENFGEFIMVLEFLHSFAEVLPLKDFFPGGVSFETVERALTHNEVAGPLSDILQLLLTTLFNMQEEEDDEILETDQTVAVSDENGDITSSEAVKLATYAASWSQMYQGTPLSNMTLDSVTLTEVLRLHLLSSGGRAGEMSSKWRYQQRGGYTSLDDPGLLLRIEKPHILKALSTTNVCDLPIADKLEIVTCLINQILTYATVRDVIDERGEKVKQLRAEIRAHQIAEIKKEREAAAQRMKERKEAKLKLKGEAAAGGGTVQPAAATGNTDTPPDSEEKDVRRQKLDRESSRRKQEIEKKSRDLYHAVFGHQLLPIGSDRAYRRFWLFSSLPGLFVENDERWAGTCLAEPTPYNPTLSRSEDTLTYVRKLFEEEWNGGSGSDKENDVGEETRPVGNLSGNKKLLAEKNTGDTSALARVAARSSASDRTWSERDKVEDSEKVAPTRQQLLICTADSGTCPVHGKSVNRTKWGFFNKEDDINLLIECLNKRGIREGELRQALILEKPQIVQNVASCPVHKLDTTQVMENYVPETRKSSRSQKQEDANLNYPPGTPIDEIMELTLRDFILEMEEKMQMGCLGSLKVNSREEWRKALSNRSYDKQCDKLVWGVDKTVKKEVKEESDSEDIPMEEENKERSISPNSSEIEISYKDPGRLLEDSEQNDQQNPVVHDLASAILQLAQCVEKKYLQKPLGAEDGSNDNSLMKRWEMSLMASTSFSQLFLHFSTLDNSIQWSRSALNAHCRLCRRRGDAENMLLCDGCNKGHHLYCLKPKLTRVPQGDWFCPKCRPPEKKSRASRNRRLFSQDEEIEEDNKEKEKAQDSQCKTTEGTEACNTCGKGGQVICCSKCPLLYHMECLVPPMKKVPRGKWSCPKCKAIKDAEREASRQLSLKLRRCSANAAVAKISVFAKRLRSNSWDDTSSVQSDPDLQPTRRSGRRSLEVDLDLPLNNAVLQDLLTDVMHHKDAWPFLRPVPRAQVPDYHLIIKRPMDFGRMKYKLNMLEYRNNSEFIADALLIFENCQMYNQVDAQEYKAGVRLGRYFEKKCKELGLQLKEEELRPPEPKKARLS